MSQIVGRLLPLEAGSPAANMALDQTLLETVDRSGCPTLRFYTWGQPTLSLGYFQPITDREGHRESQSLLCVRRATGGGAIVHHHELTYSLAMPVADRGAGAREALYRHAHQAFAEELIDLGVSAAAQRLVGQSDNSGREPFLCFQRRTREDLIVAGYKVLGSAQRRTRTAVLQHGSLLLHASRFAPQLPGIGDLGAGSVCLSGLADRLAARIALVLKIDRWEVRPPDDREKTRMREIEQARFANRDWLARR